MTDADTVESIAAALRDDPVLVHELLGNGRTDEVHDALSGLVEDLADQGVPAYVALVQTPDADLPSSADDAGDTLLRLIHQELGEPGLYVVATQDTLTAVATYDVPLDATSISLGRYDAVQAARDDLPEGEFVPAAGEAAVLLSVAADDDLSLTPGEVDDLMDSGPWVAAYGDEPMSYELDDARGEPETPLVFAVAFALVALVVGWRLLRARTAWAGGATSAPRTRRARPDGPLPRPRTPPQPRIDTTRKQARKVLAALRREVDGSLQPVTDEVHGSLEAAEDLVDSESRIEVVAALVLAEQGAARLRGDELPVRCYFDPRHGPPERRVVVSDVSLPACGACAEAVAADVPPASLTTDDGKRPYWRADSIWAATGLGSLDPDLWRLVAERQR